ncbi:MAG: DUF1998 domain-containing protein, partial [Acidobacteria bacterium]|nr:DUF1998 domain-containing protein [Acidobacteriota bacterium]
VEPAAIVAARAAANGEVARFLWEALAANPHVHKLRELMKRGPLELHAAARQLAETESDLAAFQDEEEAEAVRRLVELGALARENADGAPLLPARYHLFARGPQGAWLCLNPQHDTRSKPHGWAQLYLTKRATCTECQAGVFEMCACRNCGQPFVRAFEQEGFYTLESLHPSDTKGQRYFTWRPLTAEVEASDDETEDEPTVVSQTAMHICLGCRRQREACVCETASPCAELFPVISLTGQPKEKLHTCPRCGSRSTYKETVIPINLGTHAPLAVLTDELYQKTPRATDAAAQSKPGAGRKLLTFTDTRQGAARHAAYLQGTNDETLHRHLVARAATELASEGKVPDLKELADHCVRLAADYGLYGEKPPHEPEAQQRRWLQEVMKRILAEFCTRRNPRHALWALGLVGCDVHLPMLPDEKLCSHFGLPPQEMLIVTQAMLDTMRMDKAIAMPEGVRANDAVFGANRGEAFYQLIGNRRPNLHNWVGADDRHTRFNYTRRLLMARGKSAEKTEVQNALQAVWDWLGAQSLFVRSQTTCQLRHDRLLFPARNVWFCCKACQRLSRRSFNTTPTLCPTRNCSGLLEQYDVENEFGDNHYRALFSRQPLGMRVEEHTAQLQPDLGREYQGKFIAGDINVLSCSTTFEMGVDVGDLQTVILNNVPPTVANYRQRAGRAGRRASGSAFILTYATSRPHDQLYFADPRRIIAGEVAVPRLTVNNSIITTRHLNALLLGHFLRYLAQQGRSGLSRCGAFFAPNQAGGRHLDLLQSWRAECEKEIEQLVSRFFAENQNFPPMSGASCLTHLIASLRDRQQDFEHWLNEYERLRNDYTTKADTTNNQSERKNAEAMRSRFIALRQRLLEERLIDFLCREGVLPSYSFPIDVVELRLPHGKTYHGDSYANHALRLERDKKIAIVEYAPGAEVVADKRIWKSEGIVIGQGLNSFEYRICRTCRDLERSERGGLPIGGRCRVCGDPAPDGKADSSFSYVNPDGFTTDLTADLREAGLSVESGVNRSRSFLLAEGEEHSRLQLPVKGPSRLSYAYRREGCLVAINSGADPEGFRLCVECGVQVKSQTLRRKRNGADRAEHRTPWGGKCSGVTHPYHLGHDFKTDTLHLRFYDTANATLPAGEDPSFWRSLTYAFLAGASYALQIERRDLDGVVRPFTVGETNDPQSNYSQEIVLFDSVPGGAGHVRNIADHLEAVLRRTLSVVQCTDCTEETSCTSCLRNYDNQVYWNELRRGRVAQFLESLLAEVFPEPLDHFAVGAARVAAIDKNRWLKQQLAEARQETTLWVNRIAAENDAGEARTWLELLQETLRRGCKVNLCVAEIPVFDRNQPTTVGLRDHLRLLTSNYGLRLYVMEYLSSEAWHVLLDPQSERGRAIHIEGATPSLHSRTGEAGLVTTIHPAAVRAIAEQREKMPRRLVTPQMLETPPEVRVLHIQEGERASEAGLFGEVFRLPLVRLQINDRYLRSTEHEKRLRAYLKLVVGPAGQRTQVVISTLRAEQQPSRPPYYQTSAEQQQMRTRLQKDFPHLDIQLRLEPRLPHDRFLEVVRVDNTRARIAIGVGLDFIQASGRSRMTDILIEDPYRP